MEVGLQWLVYVARKKLSHFDGMVIKGFRRIVKNAEPSASG